jgi:hypothetical protein
MSHESKTAWLQSLKPGDEVIVYGGAYGSGDRVDKVQRVTKTLIIVRASRFNRDRGRSIGSGYSWRYLKKATPEAVRQIKHDAHRSSLIYKLGDVTWRDMPFDVLVGVDALLPSPEGDKGVQG